MRVSLTSAGTKIPGQVTARKPPNVKIQNGHGQTVLEDSSGQPMTMEVDAGDRPVFVKFNPMRGIWLLGSQGDRLARITMVRPTRITRLLRLLVDNIPTQEEKNRRLFEIGSIEGTESNNSSICDINSICGELEHWIQLKYFSGVAWFQINSYVGVLDHLERGSKTPIRIQVRKSFVRDGQLPTLCYYMAGNLAGYLRSLLSTYHPQIDVVCGCDINTRHQTCELTATITLDRGNR